MSSTNTDKFFGQMIENAEVIARKAVKTELATVKRKLTSTKKQLNAALKLTADVAKREAAVAKKEKAILNECTKEQRIIKDRYSDIKKAESEILFLLKQVDAIKHDTVTVTTTKVNSMVKRSKTGGYYNYPSFNSKALTRVIAKAKKETKK